MKPRRPALPGASKAIRAIVAGPSLVAALCLAGALAAFLFYPAYAQSGDEASTPSNLTAAIADGGVILNWSSPVQDAASVTGYEILRRRPKEGEDTLLVLVADTGSTATTYVDATANEPGVALRLPGQGASWRRQKLPLQLRPRRPARGSPMRRNQRRLPRPEASPSNHRIPKAVTRVQEATMTQRQRR